MTFVQTDSFDVSFAPVKIKTWRLSRTGLRLCHIDQPSPIVQGHFAVATEIADDSGSPHTLEHLVFMGSEKFPYKGFLDTLGNQFFSSTNAWTATDQTVYTITTAGWEGFKTMLPIYLDHVLFPTLTDEACLTEVYHIDGTGDEKGVVFCEMQNAESLPSSKIFLEMKRTMYSKTSGYSSETGGLTTELRHLTSDKIRQFHKDMYRPDNLEVIVTGTIDEEELLQIMTAFDDQLEPSSPNKKPFVDSPRDEPLKETIVKEFEFPDNDETMGEVMISWFGPKFDDNLLYEALDMLGHYFTENANSLFNKHLVEIENPMSTEVYHYCETAYDTVINYMFSDVPSDRLQELDTTVKLLIKMAAKNFDVAFMRQIINQQKLILMFDCEKKPNHFQDCVITDFIYGLAAKSDNFLRSMVDSVSLYDTLLTWEADQWCEVITTYLVNNPSVSILGKPSAKLNEKVKAEGKAFKQGILDKYGEDGLKKLGDTLKNAQEKNDKEIPQKLLTQFGVPDPLNINFVSTKSYKAGKNDLKVGYEDDEFAKILSEQDSPLFFHFEDFKSQFVTINIVLSTKNLDKRLLRYMSVMEEIFNMSLEIDGQVIPYSDVINQLNDDLIEFELDSGFDGRFLEFLHVKVKCVTGKYAQAISWIQKIMTCNIIEKERIKVIVEKIINGLPDKKRSAELMVYSKQYRTLFTENSIRKAQDSIYNEEFFEKILEDLNNDIFDEVKEDLKLFKRQLFTLDNFKVFVNGGCKDLKDPISLWDSFIGAFEPVSSPIPLEDYPRSHQFRSEVGLKCSSQAHLVSIAAIELSELIISTKTPIDYLSEDGFKIILANEYLNAVEGPFWRGVRGKGLAYGTTIARNAETGFLNFWVYSSTDIVETWTTSKKIVSDYCDGTTKFDQMSIDNSIAALMNVLANDESNLFDASFVKICDNVFRNRGPNYKKKLVEKLKTFGVEDMVEIMNKYFKQLFDLDSSMVFASIPTVKVEDVSGFFELQGYQVEVEEVQNEDLDDETDESEDSGDESE